MLQTETRALIAAGFESDDDGCRGQLDLNQIGDLIDLDPEVITGSIYGLDDYMIIMSIFGELRIPHSHAITYLFQ